MSINGWRTLGASIVLLAVSVLAAPAGAQDELELTVTPGFELEDGDTVDVSGSGFVPDSVVFLTICNDDPALGTDPVDRCSLVGAGSAGYRVATDGTLAIDDVSITTGQVGGDPDAVCSDGVDTCSLNATLEDLTVLVRVELGFGTRTDLAFTGSQSTLVAVSAVSLLAAGGLLVLFGGRLEQRQLARLPIRRRPSTIRDLPL